MDQIKVTQEKEKYIQAHRLSKIKSLKIHYMFVNSLVLSASLPAPILFPQALPCLAAFFPRLF